MNLTPMPAGTYELSIGNTLIPAQLLGELTPDYEEGTTETDTMAGSVVTPNGKPSTAQFGFTLYVPNMDYTKVVFADAYNEPTAAAQETGNVILGGNTCVTREAVKVNIHNLCESTDDNDIYFPAVKFAYNFNPTLSTSDSLALEVTGYIQPDSNGRVRLGTGNLAAPSHYDTTTQSTVPNTTPSA